MNTRPRTYRKPDMAFRHALSNGTLTDDSGSVLYLGDFMYMHTQGGFDWFKHIDTRKYILSPVH